MEKKQWKIGHESFSEKVRIPFDSSLCSFEAALAKGINALIDQLLAQMQVKDRDKWLKDAQKTKNFQAILKKSKVDVGHFEEVASLILKSSKLTGDEKKIELLNSIGLIYKTYITIFHIQCKNTIPSDHPNDKSITRTKSGNILVDHLNSQIVILKFEMIAQNPQNLRRCKSCKADYEKYPASVQEITESYCYMCYLGKVCEICMENQVSVDCLDCSRKICNVCQVKTTKRCMDCFEKKRTTRNGSEESEKSNQNLKTREEASPESRKGKSNDSEDSKPRENNSKEEEKRKTEGIKEMLEEVECFCEKGKRHIKCSKCLELFCENCCPVSAKNCLFCSGSSHSLSKYCQLCGSKKRSFKCNHCQKDICSGCFAKPTHDCLNKIMSEINKTPQQGDKKPQKAQNLSFTKSNAETNPKTHLEDEKNQPSSEKMHKPEQSTCSLGVPQTSINPRRPDSDEKAISDKKHPKAPITMNLQKSYIMCKFCSGIESVKKCPSCFFFYCENCQDHKEHLSLHKITEKKSGNEMNGETPRPKNIGVPPAGDSKQKMTPGGNKQVLVRFCFECQNTIGEFFTGKCEHKICYKCISSKLDQRNYKCSCHEGLTKEALETFRSKVCSICLQYPFEKPTSLFLVKFACDKSHKVCSKCQIVSHDAMECPVCNNVSKSQVNNIPKKQVEGPLNQLPKTSGDLIDVQPDSNSSLNIKVPKKCDSCNQKLIEDSKMILLESCGHKICGQCCWRTNKNAGKIGKEKKCFICQKETKENEFKLCQCGNILKIDKNLQVISCIDPKCPNKYCSRHPENNAETCLCICPFDKEETSLILPGMKQCQKCKTTFCLLCKSSFLSFKGGCGCRCIQCSKVLSENSALKAIKLCQECSRRCSTCKRRVDSFAKMKDCQHYQCISCRKSMKACHFCFEAKIKVDEVAKSIQKK